MAIKLTDTYKLVLLGDSGVGKTSILLRYTDDTYNAEFVATIGIDFKIKTIQLEEKTIKLQIWDTAGQERFRFITTSYLRGTKGMVVLYDITNFSSFENVTRWLETIDTNAADDVSLVLAGNKCDCNESERKVTKAMGEQLAAARGGIPFFECSAKKNENIAEIFDTLARGVLKKGPSNTKKSHAKDTVSLQSEDPKRQKHCPC